MNIPNIITIFRIILIPVFAGLLLEYRECVKLGSPEEWARYAAIIIFSIGILSDAIDGIIARNFQKKTYLGTILDPLADKMLLMTSAIFLSLPLGLTHKLPSWYPVAIIGRDVILIAGAALLYIEKRNLTVSPSLIGKGATAMQMATVLYLLFNFPSPYILWCTAVFLTIISGAQYIWQGSKQFNETTESG